MGGDDVTLVGDEPYLGSRRQNTAAQSSAVVNRIVAGQSESLQRRRRQKGLKDQERKTFMQNCLNKAANSGSDAKVSQQDKGTACNNLADQKGLKGADRRSFIKDCMNKANPQ
jgi:hypothetical protein